MMMDSENDKPSFRVIVREQEHSSLNLEHMELIYRGGENVSGPAQRVSGGRVKNHSNAQVSLSDKDEYEKIPHQFVSYVDKHLSRNAILTGPCDHQWQVSICKKGDDIYMQRGWKEFLRDNLVKDGQFLVVTYEGETHFRVQFFSTSGCERLFFTEKTDSEVDVPSPARKRGRPRKISAQAEVTIRNEGSILKVPSQSIIIQLRWIYQRLTD